MGPYGAIYAKKLMESVLVGAKWGHTPGGICKFFSSRELREPGSHTKRAIRAMQIVLALLN